MKFSSEILQPTDQLTGGLGCSTSIPLILQPMIRRPLEIFLNLTA